MPVTRPGSETGPSHQVYIGRSEIGAASSKKSNDGKPYLSLPWMRRPCSRCSTRASSATRQEEFVEGLARRGDELGERDMVALSAVAADLVANAITAQDDDLPQDRVQFERIRHRLRHAVRDPGLGLGTFARSERVSPRTLQRLFQANGTTLGRMILEVRLDGIRRDLEGAQPHTRPIGDIALSWGFNDLSHFTRAFRARYGTCPAPRGGLRTIIVTAHRGPSLRDRKRAA